jgi:hypothetical protein
MSRNCPVLTLRFVNSKMATTKHRPAIWAHYCAGVAEASIHEVEVLIHELHGLRKKLQSDGDRIQSDIEGYAELSQGVMQLTAIIADSVKKIPGAPSISP